MEFSTKSYLNRLFAVTLSLFSLGASASTDIYPLCETQALSQTQQDINEIYFTVLGYLPDINASQNYVDAIENGTQTLDDIAFELENSALFSSIYGPFVAHTAIPAPELPETASNEGFINYITKLFFNRDATTDELDTLTSELSSGAQSRAELLFSLVGSAQGTDKTTFGNKMRVINNAFYLASTSGNELADFAAREVIEETGVSVDSTNIACNKINVMYQQNGFCAVNYVDGIEEILEPGTHSGFSANVLPEGSYIEDVLVEFTCEGGNGLGVSDSGDLLNIPIGGIYKNIGPAAGESFCSSGDALQHSSVINFLYLGYLGRMADIGGAKYWNDRLTGLEFNSPDYLVTVHLI
jgi:hypothetical protein